MLKSGILMDPDLFVLLKIALSTQGLLWFHMDFSIFSKFYKNVIGILIGVILNL